MYELIQHQEVGAGGAASIIFNDIPQIYTDLYIVASTRSTSSGIHSLYWRFNNSATGYTARFLRGNGATVLTGTNTPAYLQMGYNTPSDYSSYTFSSTSFRVLNYTSSIPKSITLDNASENNAQTAYHMIAAGLWDIATDEPIESVTLSSELGNLAQYTSATLYGVGRKQGIGLSSGFPKATGGQIALRNGYWVHTFNASGTFTPIEDMEAEYLVIAGGGGGAQGAGGAGGYRSSVPGELSGGNYPAEDPISLSAGTAYTVTVGAGGAQETGGNQPGDGNNSVFGTIISIGGGKSAHTDVAGAGGSGGSASGNSTGAFQIGGEGTAGQGFRGGNGPNNSGTGYRAAGGGGGAGEIGGTGYSGSTGPAGKGGDGLPSSITGTSVYRGGGGGGAGLNGPNRALGGLGGGGNGVTGGFGQNGTANTGGGGGGGNDGGLGGSGVVIVRYKA